MRTVFLPACFVLVFPIGTKFSTLTSGLRKLDSTENHFSGLRYRVSRKCTSALSLSLRRRAHSPLTIWIYSSRHPTLGHVLARWCDLIIMEPQRCNSCAKIHGTSHSLLDLPSSYGFNWTQVELAAPQPWLRSQRDAADAPRGKPPPPRPPPAPPRSPAKFGVCVCVFHREKERKCVCVSQRDRKRECVCM